MAEQGAGVGGKPLARPSLPAPVGPHGDADHPSVRPMEFLSSLRWRSCLPGRMGVGRSEGQGTGCLPSNPGACETWSEGPPSPAVLLGSPRAALAADWPRPPVQAPTLESADGHRTRGRGGVSGEDAQRSASAIVSPRKDRLLGWRCHCPPTPAVIFPVCQ